jgi:CelD/BcsL family acetyltransferase involved in cellulose biosynthesis
MLNSQVLGDVAMVPAPAQSAPVLPNYNIEIVRDPIVVRARLDAAHREGLATPFQGPDWISAWYATLGAEQAVEPLLVFVTERNTGQAVLVLPLIRHRVDGLDVVAFADLGVTDYNAPILGPAAPTGPEAARMLWQHVVEALPPADLVQLVKMPASVGGRANPLALLRRVHPSHSPGFSVELPDDWEAYLRSLSKKFRKELARSFRLFEGAGDAAFCRIESVDEAMRVLAVMNAQQRARLEEMNYAYVIDEDDYHAFYAGLVVEGLANGTTVMTALTCDGTIVAALLGVTDGTSLAMVRLSHAGGDWMKIGPGRLVIERTMSALHQQGIRHFDFSIGDYPYKSGFGAEPSPLFDLVAARSWRGRKSAARDLAKAAVKRMLGMIGVSLVPKAVKNRYRRYHAATG